MQKIKHLFAHIPAICDRKPAASAMPIPNVGVTISKANRNVRIYDRDRVFQDILMQGEDMNNFLTELKSAQAMMPDLPIKDALVVVTAPFIAGKWS